MLFDKETYAQRRATLRDKVGSGLIILFGNNNAPCNYPANAYTFRQDSSFLYCSSISPARTATHLPLFWTVTVAASGFWVMILILRTSSGPDSYPPLRTLQLIAESPAAPPTEN